MTGDSAEPRNGPTPWEAVFGEETLKTNTATIELVNKEGSSTLSTTTYYNDGTSSTTYKKRKNRKRPQIVGVWFKIYSNASLLKEYKELNQALKQKKVPFSSTQTLPTVHEKGASTARGIPGTGTRSRVISRTPTSLTIEMPDGTIRKIPVRQKSE